LLVTGVKNPNNSSVNDLSFIFIRECDFVTSKIKPISASTYTFRALSVVVIFVFTVSIAVSLVENYS
jgi:hypothetical protein